MLDGTVDRLAVGGFGRGLLTAGLRTRLRKAGFADMGALALASPAALIVVRKVGPVRVGAIRTHVLGERARLVPGARAVHDQNATDRRRLDRPRAVPVGRLLLGPALGERFGSAGATWVDLAPMQRVEAAQAPEISAPDLDVIVASLALLPDRRLVRSAGPRHEDGVSREAAARRERAEMLRERDRAWDEAAPAV